MRSRTSFVIAVLGSAIFLFSVSPAPAQDYPTKPITMLIGYSAGGSTDLSARKIAELGSKYLNNQPVVPENRPGGAGTVAAVALANAAPDGHTISAIAFSPTVIIPHMRKVPYDTKKDFQFIMQFAEYTHVFCVRKDHVANSWKEWLDWAKKNVDKATYTTAGPGSGPHVFMQEIFLREKINPAHIPFGGGTEAVVQVLGGHVNAILAGECYPHIKSGELKPLAVINQKRVPFIPKVPSFSELGYADIRTAVWLGIAAPGKTPTPILTKLEEAFTRAAMEPAFVELLKNIEMNYLLNDSAKLRKIVEDDFDHYGKVIKTFGIQAK